MVRKKELEGLADELLQAYNSAGFTKPDGTKKFFDNFNLWRNKECNFLVGEYSQFRICAKKNLFRRILRRFEIFTKSLNPVCETRYGCCDCFICE